MSGFDLPERVTRYGPTVVSASERVRLETVFLDAQPALEGVVRRRVRSRDCVSDLVHDLYVKCRRVDLEFCDRQEARAYLLRMASNIAIDHERVEGRREQILDGIAGVQNICGPPSVSPEAYALATDQAAKIERVLADLPARARQMFILVRLYGMSHKEAAQELGVSKSLVDKYVLQALLHCRDAIGSLDKLD